MAKDNLTLLTVSPRQEDIDLYQAQVDQAGAQVKLLENQIQDSVLRSPVDGQIIAIEKRVGELVQSTSQDSVFTILPASPFEVKVDIYEEDIVKMSVGNPADISLVAFPEQIFKGKVVEIEPAEKLIEGIVYYETIVSFADIPNRLKPGMTADLTIRTASKENVLTIPKSAIQERDDKVIVEVLNGESSQQKEIKIGLKGSNDLIEVVSGLEEGDKIILK